MNTKTDEARLEADLPSGETDLARGLTEEDVRRRRTRFGPNEVAEAKPHLIGLFLKKFWGLTAWMLEAIILLSWILGKTADAAVVAGLLVMNAIVGFLEESKASRAVEELKTKLRIQVRVLRDGAWTIIPARELVPGDVVRVRPGDLLPADLKIGLGAVAVDQSVLTGESLVQERQAGDVLYAGSVLRRGEATGIVLRTGASTGFGKTIQLVQLARPKLHLEEVVAGLVKRLLGIIGSLVVLTLAVSLIRGFPILEILPLLLVLLLSAIPVALPVMFTVSMAVGARELAGTNVLITRLSAAEDAATMDVLCLDKTGTLTLNEIVLSHVVSWRPFAEEDVLLFGALASQEANQDPLDLAFINRAEQKALPLSSYIQEQFVPFNPQTRKTEASIRGAGRAFRVMKGAVAVIAEACGLDPDSLRALEAQTGTWSEKGFKTLAVAVIADAGPAFVGWVALGDGLRPDSKALIRELRALGLSVKMLTGDAWPIAREIAREVGIGERISRMSELKSLLASDHAAALKAIETSDGFAEVYPEDKYLIVQSLQAGGHVVGMTGDGVNDAPALKQAEVGIAVNSAADAAKASASVVLTSAGLSGIVDLVKNGRRVYQRINTWVLNKIQRTILKASYVAGVFLVTGDFVVSAFAMVLLLLMTDFVKISLSTDHVRWSRQPETWRIGRLVKAASLLGIAMALEAVALLALGLKLWGLSLLDPMVRTFSLEILLLSALASVFVIRERRHFWSSRPSRMLGIMIAGDAMVGILIGAFGIPGQLPPLPPAMIALTVGFTAVSTFGLNDFLKVQLLRKMKIV
ncbi:MAG: plasma-membrane proton-efflux P-type ATPase [Acidobacteriota bacterium]|nr:plasma-membrane proton-efflux P-type ATPase [Acidobacteriota bacterium]